MQIRKATPTDFPRIRLFYQERLANYNINKDDQFFLAEVGEKIVGAVRLAEEHSYLVLRGMPVASDFQKKGIGRALLKRLGEEIGNRECYCIPYAHLEGFYGEIYFRRIDEPAAPSFLQDRLKQYLLESRCILMKRDAR